MKKLLISFLLVAVACFPQSLDVKRDLVRIDGSLPMVGTLTVPAIILNGTSIIGNYVLTASLPVILSPYQLIASMGAYQSVASMASYTLLASLASRIDTANASVTGSVETGVLDFNTATTTYPAFRKGRLFWDDVNKAVAVYGDSSGPILQVGQEQWIYAYNNTAATITDGAAITINSAIAGVIPRATLALANASSTSSVLALATHDVSPGAFGFFTTVGVVRGINTLGFAAGSDLFLSDGTPGAYADVPPSPPSYCVKIGRVISSAVSGAIYVHPQVIGGLHDATFAGKIRGVDGSVTAPAFSFLNSPSMGMYASGTDNLCLGYGSEERLALGPICRLSAGTNAYFKVGSLDRLKMDLEGASFTYPVGLNKMLFTSLGRTGFQSGADANTVDFLGNGTTNGKFSGHAGIGTLTWSDSIVASSAYFNRFIFAGDVDTRIYQSASDVIGIICGGAQVATFTPTGASFAEEILWDDVVVNPTGVNLTGVPQAATVDTTQDFGALTYAGNAVNDAAYSLQMPHRWKNGTTIYPHAHVRALTTAAPATSDWEMYYRMATPGGSFPTAYSVATGAITVGAATDTHLLLEFPAVTMTGMGDSTVIMAYLRRKGDTDASNVNINVLSIDWHYQTDKRGSLGRNGD